MWAPKKLYGWKLYELVEAKGQMGYIGGRRVKGAFVVKDIVSGKTLLEVVPRKLRRLSRPIQGWSDQPFSCLSNHWKGGRRFPPGSTRAA